MRLLIQGFYTGLWLGAFEGIYETLLACRFMGYPAQIPLSGFGIPIAVFSGGVWGGFGLLLAASCLGWRRLKRQKPSLSDSQLIRQGVWAAVTGWGLFVLLTQPRWIPLFGLPRG